MNSGGRSTVKVVRNAPLKPYTTFKIGGPARCFCEVSTPAQAREGVALARAESMPLFVLGGGSNILVSDAGFPGLVLHPVAAGIGPADPGPPGGESVALSVSAGEPWDSLAGHTVDRGWWGVENLSHIPGQSGAALVQNIGAYGQQLSDVFQHAEVLDLASGELRTLPAADCGLGYRRSIFNSTRRGEFLIWSITLRLGVRPRPRLAYRDVQAYFAARGVARPSQAEVRQAIIEIRDRKFPYPREERGGNAGSFFKNPRLDPAAWQKLAARIAARFGKTGEARWAESGHSPGAPGSTPAASIAVPAALLIDLCGLKGYEAGKAQVNQSQPLVILNQGGATADDVLRVAGHVRRTVHRETGVALEVEPELVGFSSREVDDHLGIGPDRTPQAP